MNPMPMPLTKVPRPMYLRPNQNSSAKEDVGGDVLHAQRDAQQFGEAHIQRADGVVAEMGLL